MQNPIGQINFKGTMYYKETIVPGFINKIDDSGQSTTYAIYTAGYNEYKDWLLQGNVVVPYQTDVEKIDLARVKAYSRVKIGFALDFEPGFLTSLGFKIDCELEDTMLLSMAHQLAILKSKTDIDISDYDNVVQNLTIAQFETVLGELGDFVQATFDKKWTLRASIVSATTEGELNLIVW